jgi:hypothetical protein
MFARRHLKISFHPVDIKRVGINRYLLKNVFVAVRCMYYITVFFKRSVIDAKFVIFTVY